jgi:hypothetical protein
MVSLGRVSPKSPPYWLKPLLAALAYALALYILVWSSLFGFWAILYLTFVNYNIAQLFRRRLRGHGGRRAASGTASGTTCSRQCAGNRPTICRPPTYARGAGPEIDLTPARWASTSLDVLISRRVCHVRQASISQSEGGDEVLQLLLGLFDLVSALPDGRG